MKSLAATLPSPSKSNATLVTPKIEVELDEIAGVDLAFAVEVEGRDKAAGKRVRVTFPQPHRLRGIRHQG